MLFIITNSNKLGKNIYISRQTKYKTTKNKNLSFARSYTCRIKAIYKNIYYSNNSKQAKVWVIDLLYSLPGPFLKQTSFC